MKLDTKQPCCPNLEVDGVIAAGKQFDLDIVLPEDNRDVLYGVIKDPCGEPVKDAIVKLIEIIYDEYEDKQRLPVTHTFTDENGEFVFGPLCPEKEYALQIWVNEIEKIKICATPTHQGDCLKGTPNDECDCYINGEASYYKYNKDINIVEEDNSKEVN